MCDKKDRGSQLIFAETTVYVSRINKEIYRRRREPPHKMASSYPGARRDWPACPQLNNLDWKTF